MKILIAYDGSSSSKDAIQDLCNAGLPEEGVEARVLSVGEVRSPTDPALNLDPTLALTTYATESVQDVLVYALDAAQRDMAEGEQAVKQLFPQWETTGCVRLSSPASSILEIAGEWKPDLIVMGSHGRGALGRLFLGSVSLRVATEAHTSVRITRSTSHVRRENAPTVLLAFDGSHSSGQVVHKLLKRNLPPDTKLHIVTVIDVSLIATPEFLWLVGGDVGVYQEMKESHIGHTLHSLQVELKKRFTHVTTATPAGAPAHEICEEAKRTHADAIFIGSRGLSRFERMLMGSVAHGVVANAETTVEIVR